MTFDYSNINLSAVQTRYRDNVRDVIPDSIQQQIRRQCGDVIVGLDGTVLLRATCPIHLDPVLAAATAAELRRAPDLMRQLGHHRSIVSAYLTNLALFDTQEHVLSERIRELDR